MAQMTAAWATMAAMGRGPRPVQAAGAAGVLRTRTAAAAAGPAAASTTCCGTCASCCSAGAAWPRPCLMWVGDSVAVCTASLPCTVACGKVGVGLRAQRTACHAGLAPQCHTQLDGSPSPPALTGPPFGNHHPCMCSGLAAAGSRRPGGRHAPAAPPRSRCGAAGRRPGRGQAQRELRVDVVPVLEPNGRQARRSGTSGAKDVALMLGGGKSGSCS